MNTENLNSNEYWNARFSENWEACEGPRQSRFFSRIAIEHLPGWLIEQLRRQSLTLADWGCAQGDGTDVWASFIDARQIAGIDFSSVAIEQATQRYPAIRFTSEDWLAGGNDQQSTFDVVFSSNTLEHFHKPYDALRSICSRANKAIVLALPYKELERIDEHFYSFLPGNIPAVLPNGFRLVWSRVVDCRRLPNTMWSGDQVILVYAAPKWVDDLGLTLADCCIEQIDANSEIAGLNQTVVERDGQITSLNQVVTERDGQIANLNEALAARERRSTDQLASIVSRLAQETCERAEAITSLNQAINERDSQIASLNQAVVERDGQITTLSQAVAERDGQIASLNQTVVERDGQILAIISSRSWGLTRPLRAGKKLAQALKHQDVRYGLLKRMYWRLPEFLRHRLNRKRHAYVARQLQNRIALANKDNSAEHRSGQSSEWIIRANQAERIAIVPCGFEFNDLVNQRPINAAKYFAEQGYFVVFVPWQWSPQDVLSKGSGEVWPSVYQVPLFSFISEVEGISGSGDCENFSVFMITMPAPALINLIPLLRQRAFTIVYDIMDEWEAFSKAGQAPWYSRPAEDSLVMHSDYVCGVSPALRDKFLNLRSDISVIGNGYMPDVIGREHKGVAGSQRKQGELIVGYFGHLTDAWFDWDLVFRLARKRQDISFEIIGYGEPAWAAREASMLPNVHMLGRVLPKELHRYASRWSAGIIPFLEGDLAEAVDPIKIYEYLYFGLPTVVTGIRHLQTYPMTYFVERERVHEAIDVAINSEPDPEKLDSFLKKTTWRARFDALTSQVKQNQNCRLLYAN